MTLNPASGPTSYRQLFGVRGFPQLASGMIFARTANQLWQVALVLFVLQRFHSPLLAGAASFLSVAPGLVVSPIAGALLDRHGRVRLILSDYALAALSLTLIFALARAGLLTPVVLLIIVAFSSLTGPLSASGARTLFPLLVPRPLWDRANAMDSGSQAIATVLGPALAGFLIAWVGGPGAFLATAGIYGLAAVVLVGITDPATEQFSSAPLLRASWQALVFVLRHATLRGIMFTLFTANIGFGMITVALPVLVLTQFHAGAQVVGTLWSVAGVATVASGLIFGRINTEGRERRMVALGMLGASAGCVLLAIAGAPLLLVVGAPLLLVVGMVLFGLSMGPGDIGLFALRQRRTDPRWFGRAFAVSMSLNYAGAPIGAALGGLIVEHSVLVAFILAAIVSAAACGVAFATIPPEAQAQKHTA